MALPEDSNQTSRGRLSLSPSVYQSSDVVTTSHSPVPSRSVKDIVTLSLQPCEACQRTEGAAAKDAKWFCRECEEHLCDECKSFHKKFKMSAGHNVVNLQVLCNLCTTKNITSTGIYYCRECETYLCTECMSWHQQLKLMEFHTVIKSQDKIREMKNELGNGPSFSALTTKGHAKWNILSKIRKMASKKASVADHKAQHVGTVSVQSAEDTRAPVITSSAFLSDSSLLLVDRGNKKLKHFDSRFQLIQVKRFKDHPRRIAVNGDEAVITTSGSSIIKLSVKDTIEEKGSIAVSLNCRGIDFIDKDRLAVAGDENPGIFCVYAMHGIELSRTTTDKMGVNLFCLPYYVTVDRERQHVFVSDYDNKTVVALDLRRDNNVLFRYTAGNFLPVGIAVTKGHINICKGFIDGIPGSVQQITAEGVYNKLLLSKKKCMKYPRTISFTPSGDRFIVCGGEPRTDAGKDIHVYNLR